MKPHWVDSHTAVQRLCAALETAGPVGLDTEFVRERTYRPQLALLQCQTGEQTWLVDVTAGTDFSPLAYWLGGAGLKVFHSCREDLEVLTQTLAPVRPPVWDTQLAHAFLGGPLQLSYQKLVQHHTGVVLEKGETRSDWLRRPLSPAQRRYAAEDVIWLPCIQSEQAEQLATLGRRDWFDEDMDQLLAEASREPDSSRLHLGSRAALDMDEASLRRYRDLLYWREQTARQRNLPRGFVLKNDVLHRLALQPPGSLAELESLPLHPAFVRRHGEGLLALLQGEGPYALEAPPAPPLPPLNRPEDKQALARLRQHIAECAGDLRIEPTLIGTRKDMEHYLRWQQGLLREPGRLGQGWRAQVLDLE